MALWKFETQFQRELSTGYAQVSYQKKEGFMNKAQALTIIQPPVSSAESIAEALKDKLLRDWDIETIQSGIKCVGRTDGGVITHAYMSPGLFRTLCYQRYGRSWLRRPFRVGGYVIGEWKGK